MLAEPSPAAGRTTFPSGTLRRFPAMEPEEASSMEQIVVVQTPDSRIYVAQRRVRQRVDGRLGEVEFYVASGNCYRTVELAEDARRELAAKLAASDAPSM